jgi:natural product biosynthesis luciferase-like monooxygenase protein
MRGGMRSFPLTDPAPTNLVEVLRSRARLQPGKLAFTFLSDGEIDEAHLSFEELDRQARSIGAWLQECNAAGERVLLVYPPGLQFIAGFWGCLYAGAVAVPAYPPRLNGKLLRLQAIVADSQARVVLTDASTIGKVEPLLSQLPALRELRWIGTDELLRAAQPLYGDLTSRWKPPELKSSALAFIQYTSGSTGQPRGAMISHGNLLHNQRLIEKAFMHPEGAAAVGWLPLYHDMGLIGNVVHSLYSGAWSVLMSPVAFIQRPVRWLEAITRYRAVTSGGPNFAYDLCVRKVATEQLGKLDLSSWTLAFNGAEPIRSDVLERFANMFGPCGFRREAFYPCYGLAEATLIVAGGNKHVPPVVRSFRTEQLEQRKVVETSAGERYTRTLVGCGQSLCDQQVLIVDPASRRECTANGIGEVWVRGDSIAQGYWNKPDETEETFNARLADCEEGPFLRTGDLGFMKDGELFITGRLKDLIIINGRNHYPQDIERTIEQSHPAIRTGCVAVFGVEIEGEERLVTVQEIERAHLRSLDARNVKQTIRDAVAVDHELEVHAVVLLRPGMIPKTTSGKLQRQLCRKMFLDGSFETVDNGKRGSRLGRKQNVVQLFEHQVQQRPNAIAMVSNDAHLTYRELDQQANRLAHYLLAQGIKPGSRVGVSLGPSPESLIGILAIFKVCGICVPVIPSGLSENTTVGVACDVLLTSSQEPLPVCSARIVLLNAVAPLLAEFDGANPPPRVEENAPTGVAYKPEFIEQSAPVIMSGGDLFAYFERLDKCVGCQAQDSLLTTANEISALVIMELVWVLTRGARIIFSTMTGVALSSVPPSSQAAVTGMQFSLFYFSSNEAEFSDNKYQLLIEGAKFADKHDFTAVWVPERHFHAFGGIYPNPSVLGSALAMITERIRIRAGSVVLPLHNTIRVAEEWSVVDNLSRGRVDLAFARGWNPNDFVLSPESYANSAEILFTELRTVLQLWKGETIRIPNGVGKETEIKIHPLPKQRELTFWITCSGGAERFKEAGACGANVLTALLFQSVEELKEKIAAYADARAKHGHNPETGHVTLMLHTFVDKDMDAVRRLVREPFIEYLKTSVNLWRQGSKSLEDLTQQEQENLLAFALERYFHTSALFGTPTTCLSTVNRLKAIGVDEIACLVDFGIENNAVLRSLEALNVLRMSANGNATEAETLLAARHWKTMLEQYQVTLVHGPAELLPDLASYAQAAGSPRSLKLLLLGETAGLDKQAERLGADFKILTAAERERILLGLDARTQTTAPEETIGQHAERVPCVTPTTETPPPDAAPSQSSSASAPWNETPIEDRELLRWVQEIIVMHLAQSLAIEAEKVPLNKNFYSLGVSSLKAVEMMDALGRGLGVPLSPTILFEAPTVAGLARYFARTHGEKLGTLMRNRGQTLTESQTPDGQVNDAQRTYSCAEVSQGSAMSGLGHPAVRPGDVAVIGMSCRFPQAPNLQAFWELLRDGKDAVTEVPLDHWDWRPFYDSDPDAGDKTYSRWGGFLNDIDKFDPTFFNISPREARLMDPQQRIFLEVAWETCEHAGYSPERLAEREVGVFVGCSNNSYYHRIAHALTVADHAAGIGNQNAIIANRVSFFLNLHGPSLLIDTMCSSSLVAVHLALQSLRQGECELALAGGVNILLSPEYYVAMSRMKAHSPDGRCKAFDHRANGIVFGEGAGAVLLKPLSSALADNDAIYAVIKGSAVNHGGQTNGLTAPNPNAQARLISRALEMAGATADTISYVEAHGTGTSLGDPIEIEGLTKAFRQHTDRKQFCAIGSVKTNIGHLEPAAGISGLIKVILSMQQGQIPPTLHFEKANPLIPFEESPFRVNSELRSWETQSMRRAAVSSFGIGGSNAHVVLEEAPSVSARVIEDTRPLRVLTLSAQSENALRQLAGRYAEHLANHPAQDLRDICFTANTGRVHFAHRLAVTVETAERVVRQLRSFIAGEETNGLRYGQVQGRRPPKVAFLFTGQGAQFAGMGRQLYQTEPTFRGALEHCDQLLRPHLKQPLLSVLYPEGEKATGLLGQTAYAQPALFALEYALATLWRSWGIVPEAVLGHSVGEYAAACVAGVFSLDEGLRMMAGRGQLMQSLPGGGEMAAVFAPEERVREAIAGYADEVSVAAINTPEQVVISGPSDKVERVLVQLERDGVRTQRLDVSHAFHSLLMEPILDQFKQQAQQVVFHRPHLPLVSNLTGCVWQEGEKPDASYWRRHLREPVRFDAGVRALAAAGCELFIEIGPTPILLGMAATVLPGPTLRWLPSLRKGRDDWSQVSESVCALYLAGVEVDWMGFEGHYSHRRVPLPTYPFQRKRYWFESTEAEPYVLSPFPQEVVKTTSEDLVFTPQNNGSISSEKEAPMETQAHKLNDGLATATGEPTKKVGILAVLQPLMARFLEMDPAQIGLHTPFLEMGADSLVLIDAVQTIQNRFGIQIPIRHLFEEYTTLDALASYLEQKLTPDVVVDVALSPTVAVPSPNGESKPAVQSQATASLQYDLAHRTASATVTPYQKLLQQVEGDGSMAESSLERVMAQQLQMLQRLMTQQLEVLQSSNPGHAPHSSLGSSEPGPESIAQQEPSAHNSVPVAAPTAGTPSAAAATPAAGDGESIKASPWVPYQPLNPGRMEELSPRQQEYLKAFIARYLQRTPESKRQTQRYRMVHADLKPALSFRLCTKEIRYPIIGARSRGSRLWDVDDNEYVDFTMGYGLNLFGHNPPFIQEAIEEQLKLGMHLGPQTQLAGEVAELITELTGLERVAFCNTGTEAIMAALRLARTATGRNKVAVFAGSYHGTWDGVLVNPQSADGQRSSVPMVPGIPAGVVTEVSVLNYGSMRSLEVLKEHLHELAAVLVEPVQSRKPDLQPREFLHEVRRLTEEAGVALIFDEVITGFRILPGGAQAWFGVQADLATYGKIVGGGLPIGVVAGKARFMDPIDGGMWTYGDLSVPGARTTLYSGTFCKHPLAMAAGRAVLRRIKERADEIYPRLNRSTAQLAERLNTYFESENVPIHLSHFGSLFRLGGSFQLTSQDGMDLLFYHFIHKGVYVWEGRNWFLSTAHTDEEIQRMIDVVKESVAEMRDGGFLPDAASGLAQEREGQHRSARKASSRSAASSNEDALFPSVDATPDGDRIRAKSKEAPRFALTDSQKHFWLLSQMEGEISSAYNQSIILRMVGTLRLEAMRRAFQLLINRHEALRTTFYPSGDFQQVAPAMTIEVPLLDFSDGPEASRKVDEWLKAESCNSFDLSRGPLLRTHILKLDELSHLLVLTAHHIVTDGWSLGVLVRELSSLYSAECEGKACQLPRPVPFREYLERQVSGNGLADVSTAKTYWLKRMDNAPSLDLAPDYPRPPTPSYEGARQLKTLDAILCADLMRVSGELGGTPFMTLLAIFNVLLRQLTGQKDIVVVVPVAGQALIGEMHLIGDCSNLLPLRTQFGNHNTFADYLDTVKEAVLDANEHASYSFTTLMRGLNPPRDPSRWPCFNIDRPPAVPKFFDLKVELAQSPISYTNFDIGLNIIKISKQLQLAFDYKNRLFDAETIRRWMHHYETLLRTIVADPESSLEDLPSPMLPPAQTGGREQSGLAKLKRAAPYEAPRTEMEDLLAKIWAEVLGVERVGVHDNFFELGGHSLLATQFISRVRETFKVELPLTPMFEQPTVATLAAAVERARGVGQSPSAPPIERIAREGPLPLSLAQQRLWFIEQLEPGNLAYNILGAVRLRGELNAPALERAFNEIIRRHESLRTTFAVGDDGTPIQLIKAAEPFRFSSVDLRHLHRGERAAEALRRGQAEARRPFDLRTGPLMRLTLFQLDETDYVVVLTMHHIVSDGWSVGVFFYEVATLYQAFSAGNKSPLPDLSIQYVDYARWQREYLQGGVLETQLNYWLKQLTGAPQLLEVPTDRPRLGAPSFSGANEPFTLPASLTDSLRKLSQDEGATLFMTLLASFKALLYRYSGQDDMIVGTDIANRNRIETEGLIGFFVNLLPLRTNLAGDPTFRELLERVRDVTIGAYAHQDVPFEQIVSALRPDRHLSRTPLVQVLFVMQNTPMPTIELPGLKLDLLPLYTETAEFELIVSIEERAEGLTGTFAYSSELFDRSTIIRMQRQYLMLLESLIVDPDQHLSAFSLLSGKEMGGLSTAKFPDAELSQKDLENLVMSLNQERK